MWQIQSSLWLWSDTRDGQAAAQVLQPHPTHTLQPHTYPSLSSTSLMLALVMMASSHLNH